MTDISGAHMIKPDMIPDEVVEAAARAITMALVLAVDDDCRACALTDDERAELARASIIAALNAWPGVAVNDGCPVWHAYPHIILPLPMENTNDQA